MLGLLFTASNHSPSSQCCSSKLAPTSGACGMTGQQWSKSHSSPSRDGSSPSRTVSMSGVTRKAMPAQLKNAKTVNNLMSFKSTGHFDLDRTSGAASKQQFQSQTCARHAWLARFARAHALPCIAYARPICIAPLLMHNVILVQRAFCWQYKCANACYEWSAGRSIPTPGSYFTGTKSSSWRFSVSVALNPWKHTWSP